MSDDQVRLKVEEIAMLREILDIQNDLNRHHRLACSGGASALATTLFAQPGEGKLPCSDDRCQYVATLLQLELVVRAPRATTQTARYEVSRRGKKLLHSQMQLT